ncbi:myb-like DNA-binding protein bas1 [Lecanora helva]
MAPNKGTNRYGYTEENDYDLYWSTRGNPGQTAFFDLGYRAETGVARYKELTTREWTDEEELQLAAYVEQRLPWNEIAERIKNVTILQCQIRTISQREAIGLMNTPFSEAEKKRLRTLNEMHPSEYATFADQMPHRTPFECQKCLEWSREQDRQLEEYLGERTGAWHHIERRFPEKKPEDVRKRVDDLGLSLSGRTWTPAEDENLMNFRAIGQPWWQIATSIPGRSADACTRRHTGLERGDRK